MIGEHGPVVVQPRAGLESKRDREPVLFLTLEIQNHLISLKIDLAISKDVRLKLKLLTIVLTLLSSV